MEKIWLGVVVAMKFVVVVVVVLFEGCLQNQKF